MERAKQAAGIVAIAVAITVTMAGRAGAQDGVAEGLAASRLATIARAVLVEQDQAEARAALAERVLRVAVELDPADTHLWRLRLEAAELSGDEQTRRQTLRQYVQHQRRDDAAQLRLIDALARQEETVADRLGVYERLLDGDGADRLSPALRSRVAYRAARLHREQGRTRDYAERLKQALSLDESNPAAAAEALFFLERREAGDVELMQALLTLLSADPGNSATQERIARRLLACGQYGPAAQWYGAVSRLWEVSGMPGEAEVLALVSDWALALWGAGEAQEALGLIDSFAEAYGIEDIAGLPVGLQTLRAAMLQSQGDEQGATEAVGALVTTLEQRYERDEEDGRRLADVAWAHLLFEYELEAVEPLMRKLETMLAMDDPTMRRLRIWQAARAGEADRAAQLLSEAAEPTTTEQLGGYLAQASQMSREEEVEALTALFEASSDRLVGAWAADRLRQMGARAQADDACRTIGRLVQGVPPVLREGAAVAGELVALSVEPVHRRLDYGEPVAFDVELSNRAEVPLSLGETGALAATVMLAPQVQVGEGEPVSLEPQFVELSNRLRVEGAGSLRVRVRLDQADLARLLDAHPLEAVRLSVVAVLNPQLADDGRFVPGVFGAAVEAPTMVRTTVELTQGSVDALIERMGGDDSSQALFAATRLTGLAAAAAAEGQEELAGQSVEAVEGFFADLGPAGRAFVLSHVLGDAEVAGLFERLIERARSDEAAAVQAVLLTGGVGEEAEPDAMALEVALARPESAAHELATLVQAIREGEDGAGAGDAE